MTHPPVRVHCEWSFLGFGALDPAALSALFVEVGFVPIASTTTRGV